MDADNSSYSSVQLALQRQSFVHEQHVLRQIETYRRLNPAVPKCAADFWHDIALRIAGKINLDVRPPHQLYLYFPLVVSLRPY
jgi:hypothetical protein